MSQMGGGTFWGHGLRWFTFRACHLLTRVLHACCGGPTSKYPKEKDQGFLVRWKVPLALVAASFCHLEFSVHWETEFGLLAILSFPSGD